MYFLYNSGGYHSLSGDDFDAGSLLRGEEGSSLVIRLKIPLAKERNEVLNTGVTQGFVLVNQNGLREGKGRKQKGGVRRGG